MLTLLADSAPQPTPQPYAEAVARLASVRHALKLVDAFGGGPASDFDLDSEIASAWPEAGEPRRRCFDTRSERLVSATAAGVESLLVARKTGREPHCEANRELVDQIRREMADISKVILD